MLKNFMLGRMRAIDKNKRVMAALSDEVTNYKIGTQTANMAIMLDGLNGTTEEELAVYTALALYAYHRRFVRSQVHCKGISFGAAVRKLIAKNAGMSELYRRRFNSAASARDLSHFAYEANPLVKLFAQNGINLDYLLLAEQLVGFHDHDEISNIRLSWARDLYSI